MNPSLVSVFILLVAAGPAVAQQVPADSGEAGKRTEEAAIRESLASYVEAFNSHDAVAVGQYWAVDGVSVADESGERTEGREALQKEFTTFFEENPSVRLTGEATSIHMIKPDVAMIDGQTALFVADAEPVETAFSAILVKEGDGWLISSSHERDLPTPATPHDALKDLEWLLGTWEDQTEGAQVTTTVRWSPSQAFLIRSFSAQFEEETLQGTQVIGWDPLSKQIRTWTFNSDGSFGQGTVSKHDNDWLLKMWEIQADGRLAAATKVMTRVDDDTVTVQTIGQTVDGEPSPTLDPVTVVRTADAAAVSQSDAATSAEGGTP